MNVGSLFAGIGGFDLGLERAGMRTAWFCENDDYCQRVLAKHWPGVPCYGDIRELRAVDVEPVDVLCGGFPCQDISAAGKGAGLSGARSGLWSEYARLVGELRPRYVIVENVPLLRTRGLAQVLADLDACGYDAEWDGISAAAVGAPHRRDRFWLVAYPQRIELRQQPGRRGGANGADPSLAGVDGEARSVGDAERNDGRQGRPWRPDPADSRERQPERPLPATDAHGESVGRAPVARGERHHWAVEPDVGRVANGVPARVDRLRALGNALIPQIAERIGHRIVSYEAALTLPVEEAA